MQTQPLSSKLGEVKYRSKIVKQQLGESTNIQNEPTAREFRSALEAKLRKTEETFKNLTKRGIAISPYLEIGSEHCLRPALLENKFNAKGIASDISLYSLANAPKFAKQFNFRKVPQTICADAQNLPFKSNAFPFVFIYETLHHFPSPEPVLKEAYRVLTPGGLCLLGADPISQSFQIKLWRRPTKLRAWEKFLKYALILPFISHIGKTEVEHGIIETAFSLKTWQRSLSIFDRVEAKIMAFPFGPTESVQKTDQKNWIYPSLKTRIPLHILGGGLQALCFKKNSPKKRRFQNLNDLLICPDCRRLKKEIGLSTNFKCPNCGRRYKRTQKTLILLENKLGNLIGKI